MKKYILLLAPILLLASCRDARIEEHNEWNKIFEELNVHGALEYIDNNKERVLFSNKDFNALQINASGAYQILSSVVAIESAVAPTEQYKLPWDGQYRSFNNGIVKIITDTTEKGYQPTWNKDLTLAEAFQSNAVPYFQQLTDKITKEEMRHFIDTIKFGNMNYNGDTTNFWNNGNLLISADELVGFLKKLYHGELKGFNERSQRVTRGIFQKETDNDYTIYYKKLNTNHNDTIVVQYVGFVEKIKNLKNPKTNNVDPIPHPYFYVLSVYDTDKSKDLDAIAEKAFKKVLTITDLKKGFDNIPE